MARRPPAPFAASMLVWMLETLAPLALVYAAVFVVNVVPLFMPATWMVLAFAYIRFELPLLPLTIGGAIISGLGRLALARLSFLGRERFLRRRVAELAELKEMLEKRRGSVGVFVFIYTLLLPLPNNHLFIAGGMLGLSLVRMLLGFWAARILADTFWVWTSDRVYEGLGDLFGHAFRSPAGIALQVLAALLLVLLFRLPWARWIVAAVRRHPA